MKTKYKVGDKVIVNEIEWYNSHRDRFGDNFTVLGDNNIKLKFLSQMKEYCGEVLLISKVCDTYYECVELESKKKIPFQWCDMFFSGKLPITKKEYKYGLIKNTEKNEIILSDTIIKENPVDYTHLINVSFNIDANGMLHLKGKEISYGFAQYKTDIKDLDVEPLKGYIKHEKGCKWLGIKPYDYVKFWYGYIDIYKCNVQYTIPNFILKQID